MHENTGFYNIKEILTKMFPDKSLNVDNFIYVDEELDAVNVAIQLFAPTEIIRIKKDGI